MAVTSAAPALSSYLCVILYVCMCTHTILVCVSSSVDYIKATGYIFFTTESAFLFSCFSDSCLDRLFLDTHLNFMAASIFDLADRKDVCPKGT